MYTLVIHTDSVKTKATIEFVNAFDASFDLAIKRLPIFLLL